MINWISRQPLGAGRTGIILKSLAHSKMARKPSLDKKPARSGGRDGIPTLTNQNYLVRSGSLRIVYGLHKNLPRKIVLIGSGIYWDTS